MNDKKIELLDENGIPTIFHVVADFKMDGSEYGVNTYDGNEYAVLLVDNEDLQEAHLFKIIEQDNGEEPIFSIVEDDKEFELVSKYYEYIMSENDGL